MGVTEETEILKSARTLLEKLFVEAKMPESHGLQHCLTVLGHMDRAIDKAEDSIKHLLTHERMICLKLAAFLHEADDHKYFPSNSKFENARAICQQSISDDEPKKEEMISEIVMMISLVSASVNGNSVPDQARTNPTLLWPRYCDRLESIGVIGAVRCYQYNSEKGDPLMLDTTPRPKTEEEVWQHVAEERWSKYQSGGGSSASMMDHYYDKLLHVAKLDPEVVRSDYLVSESKQRVKPLVDICIESGVSGEAPVKTIQGYENNLTA